MRVFAIAGGYALPVFELANVPFHGVARLVPRRIAGLGIGAPAPDRNDGLDAPLRQSRAQSVNVISPVRDHAGQRRVCFPHSQKI